MLGRQIYRYPNDFGYFKGQFHLTIYLNVGDKMDEDGMGSAATNSRLHNSTQLLHLALAGLELDHQPPTQELINEG